MPNDVPAVDRDEQLQEAILVYLKAADSGQPISQQELMGRYPDLIDELTGFFADQLKLDPLLAPMRVLREAVLPKSLGDFRIVGQIGHGGMGIVYEAEQISLQRRVALKVLPFAATMDPRHLQRFHNEARAAAGLHHAHIVPVYFVGCERSVHFYAMQFIEGQSLAELIAAQRHDSAGAVASAPCSPTTVTQPLAVATTQATPRDAAHFRRIAEWGIQAAKALEHAHSLGIVHRDIKPSNLMIDAAGKLWVTDFGLARTATDAGLTMTGDVVGTLRYMSPEQALAKHGLVDHRSDIYSLGATLYELLTLRPVVYGKDREEILRKITFEGPRSPRSLDRAIPADLETIVLKALSKEPVDRYATALTLSEDLKRWLRGEPIQARRIGWWWRSWRWCRRNPTLAIVSGLAIAALLSTTVVSLAFAFRESQNAKALGQALDTSETNRRQAERRLAENYLDQGLTLCEQGEIGLGLHWLVLALETLPEDQSDLEWAIRANLAGWASRIHVLKGILEHKGPVLAVTYSPDGQTILTGSEDGTVRFWEAATGKHLDRDLTLPGGVRALALSPGGRTLVTVSGKPKERWLNANGGYTRPDIRETAGGIIRFWETATGNPLSPPRAEWGRSLCVTFSPDGQTLGMGDRDRNVRIRQVHSSKLHCPPLSHPEEVWALAFSPDGKRIAAGGFALGVRLWETATGRPVSRTFGPKPGSCFALSWSPDGRWLAAANPDYTAQIWDAVTGNDCGFVLQHRDFVSAIAFSPNSRTILTGCYDNTARLWDATTGKSVGQPLAHQGQVQAVAFNPNGESFVTADWNGTARLWRRGNSESWAARIRHEDELAAASFTPDGQALLTSNADKIVRLWDWTTGKLLWKTPPLAKGAHTLAISPTGKLAATGEETGAIQLREVISGKLVCQFHHEHVNTLAFSPDGRFLLSGGGSARLWDVLEGKAIDWISSHPGRVEAVSFSRDGQLLLTGGSDKAVRLWDAATRRPIGEALSHNGAVGAIALSLDDRTILSATGNGLVYRWDRDTRAPLGQPLQPQDTREGMPCFSPDGRNVLFAFGDGVAELRDVAIGRRIGPRLRHFGGVDAIAFSPDGRSLLTQERDHHTALMWEVPASLNIETAHVTCWIQAITGLELDTNGAMRVLDAPRWHERQRRLYEMGGSP